MIRALTHGDHGLWLSLRRKLWPQISDATLRGEQAEILADPKNNLVCFAQTKGGQILGFAEFGLRDWAEGCTSRPVGYVEAWYVEPHARRTGVGRSLLEFGASWARKLGCTEMASDAELLNTGSQVAHQALGFTEVLRLVLYAKRIAP